jgi:hypothetical protein
MRKIIAGLLLVLLAVPALQAGREPLAGNWKITFADHDNLLTFWLVKLESKDGKWNGTVVSNDEAKLPETTIHDLTVKDGLLKFKLKVKDVADADVVCKVPKAETKKLRGSLTVQGTTLPVILEATKDDNLKGVKPFAQATVAKDTYKELKETVDKEKDDLSVFAMAEMLVAKAVQEKVAAADLKAALAPVLTAAGEYGGTWLQEVQTGLARRLANQEAYAAIGEDLARQALKEAGNGATAEAQLNVYGIIAISLDKQGKKEDASKVRETINTLEVKGHEENEKVGLGFTPEKFKGRKGNKVVLVELFTGAQCPPCVAADLAFEGLGKTYSDTEVILLQYHLHIPGPDPMTSKDTEARQEYYGAEVRGTPTIFFNGESKAGGGGGKAQAEPKYKQYREIIDPLLNGDTKIKINVEAKRTGDDIVIQTTASGYKAGDKLKLRLALVEPWVRYRGNNGLAYHDHVVRALPGGPDGFVLSKDDVKETAKINLRDLREKWSKNLDQVTFLDGIRPFSFRNLHVVAFIQDDASKEVLMAVEAAVK